MCQIRIMDKDTQKQMKNNLNKGFKKLEDVTYRKNYEARWT